MYFDRIGFHHDRPSLQLDFAGRGPRSPYKILKGLRLSFDLKWLNVLDCEFTTQYDVVQMKEVRKLINLLDVVSSLHLHLYVQTFFGRFG